MTEGRQNSISLTQDDFGVNDAILDWKILRGAERPFRSLTSLSDLMCFFSLVEAAAIYDRLWVATADIGFFDALKPLVNREIVVGSTCVPDKLHDPEVRVQFEDVAQMLRHGEMARLSEIGAVDQATEPTYARYIYAENKCIDSVLDPVLTSYVPLVKQQAIRTLASRLTTRLSELYREQIETLVEGGAPIAFYIPPAPAVILDRSAGNQNRIVDELLVIREEFAIFRAKYRQYQTIVSTPSSHSPEEIADALRQGLHEVETAFDQLRSPRTGSRLVSDMLDVSIGGSDSGLSISKPFGSLAKGLWRAIKGRIVRGRAQCLFDLWHNANRIRGYDSILQRNFDLEDTALSEDVDLLRKLGLWIDRKVGTLRKENTNA